MTAYLQAEAKGRQAWVRITGALANALPKEMQEARKGMRKPVHKLKKALYGRTRS